MTDSETNRLQYPREAAEKMSQRDQRQNRMGDDCAGKFSRQSFLWHLHQWACMGGVKLCVKLKLFQLIFVQLAVQRPPAHADLFGGQRPVAAAFFQGTDNQLLFRFRNG